jgi:hypothetical protein
VSCWYSTTELRQHLDYELLWGVREPVKSR